MKIIEFYRVIVKYSWPSKKQILGSAFASILVSTGVNIAAAAESQPRERVLMDANWRFHLGDFHTANSAPTNGFTWRAIEDDRGESIAEEMASPTFDDSAWKEATVHENVFKKCTKAWYRAKLTSPPGHQRVVYFGGVNDFASIYFNGKKIHRSEEYRESFEVDLSSLWSDSGANVLAVMLENVDCQAGALGIVTWKPEISLEATAANYDDATWSKVELPHDYVVEGVFDPKADRSHGYLPVDVGWYRKTFTLPQSDRGRQLWVDFDGVYRNCTVWLNGKQLGTHQSGFTSFRYDITEAANYGGENLLTVRVDPRTWESWWYDGGGIYRHVWLNKANSVFVAPLGTYVTSKVADNQAEITIQTTLINRSAQSAELKLHSKILTSQGQDVGITTADISLPPGTSKEITQTVTVLKPNLWSVETPNMYQLVSAVNIGEQNIDEVRTPFGIRTIRFDADKGFFLNDKPVKIKGTCNHQDHAGLGVALPDSVIHWRIEKLKEMGSNAYRCSHNPPTPELLDACDRLGMLVLDENRKLGDSPERLSQLESLIVRDRNHPSIIMWSLCNEEGEQGTEKARKWGETMNALVKRFDTTRPVVGAMNGDFGNGLSNAIDMQGFNYFINFYDSFHAAHPKQPCFASETASAVNTRGIYEVNKEGGHLTGYDVHWPFWGTSAENAWKVVVERPWMAGAFVWTGFDYRGEPTPYDWPCISSSFGILDTCGFPKDAFYYYQSWWSDKTVLHVFPHWNWQGKDGKTIDVWAHSNCEKVELILNGKSLGTKEMTRNGHLEWKVPYAPGKLEARGYQRGEVVINKSVETTGPPAKLRLTPEPNHFVGNGKQVVLVKVEVLDENDRLVPTATNKIQFTVDDGGQIAGVGNGDPSCHEPDKASTRSAFGGLCQVIVQPAKKKSINLKATSPGLQTATTSISK